MAEDIKLVTEEADAQAVAEKMATDIRKMYEDMDRKLETGYHHLLDQLEIMAQKYRTANGVMMALGAVRDVFGDNTNELMLSEEIDLAKGAANELSRVAWSMYDKAEKLTPDDEGLGDFCDGFYNPEFSGTENDPIDMVSELMRLQLCQQIGPMANDLFEFCGRATLEIDSARQNLMEYCEANDIDFDELCSENEKPED